MQRLKKLMSAKFKTSLVEGPAAIEKRQQRDHMVYFCRSDLNLLRFEETGSLQARHAEACRGASHDGDD